MSVINTMLKDLDRRGVDYTDSNDAILAGLNATGGDDNDTRTNNPYLIGIASTFAVIAVLAVGYYVSPYQLTSVSTEQDSRADIARTEAEQPAATTETAAVVAALPATVIEPEPPAQTVTEAEPAQSVQSQSVQADSQPEASEQAETVTAGTATSDAVPAKVAAEPVIKPAAKKVAAAQGKTAVLKQAAAAEPDPYEDAYNEGSEHISKKQREFSPEEKSQQAYAAALKHYNDGGRENAKASLQQSLQHSAANKEARALLAAMYLEDGKPEIAAEMLAQGLAFNAGDQQLLRLYLQAQVQSGNYAEAIAVMERRLRLTQPEDYGYLAGLYQKNNDHINAVKMYARALQLRPSNSVWWMGQGISFEMMQQYDEAIKSYQQSLNTGRLSGKLARYATSRINSIKQLNGDSVS